MGLTLRSMNLGDILVFGQYSCIGNGSNPIPLRWMKATPNCDFITEGVADILQFDGMENWPGEYRPKDWPSGGWEDGRGISRGDPHFGVSTLLQYLNSDQDDWFVPQHEYDKPPTRFWPLSTNQHAHSGFLRFFEAHEIKAIVPKTVSLPTGKFTSMIRIPTVEDMYGGDSRLNLFKKKRGVRAHPTSDLESLIRHTHYNTGDKCYLSYFLADISQRRHDCVSVVGKDSYLSYEYPANGNGVRPLMTLNPKTRVEMIGDGVYQVLPKGSHEMKPNTMEDMFAFFGIAQP